MITLYHASYNKYKDSILKEGLKVASKDRFLAWGPDFYSGPYVYLTDNPDTAKGYAEGAFETYEGEEEGYKELTEAFNSGIIVFKVELPDKYDLQLDENNTNNWDLLIQANNVFHKAKNLEEKAIYEDVEDMPLHVFLDVAKKLDIDSFTFTSSNNIPPEYITEM